MTHALDSSAYLLLGQRALPARVRVDEDQRRDKLGILAVELLYDSAAPGEAGDVRRAERDRLDQRREAVRVLRQAEARGHVRGATCPRLVPGDDRELVGQGSQLRLPYPTILGAAVYQDKRRPLADPLVRDLEPARPDDLHPPNLHSLASEDGSAANLEEEA